MKIYVLIVFCFFSLGVNAQAPENNIWDITVKFMVENGELESKAINVRYPVSDGEGVVELPFLISDYDKLKRRHFIVPNKNVLEYYVFGKIEPHKPKHIIYFKAGAWFIVNMKKELPEIMIQYEKLCKTLNLNYDEKAMVLDYLLERYKNDQQNDGGVEIVG